MRPLFAIILKGKRSYLMNHNLIKICKVVKIHHICLPIIVSSILGVSSARAAGIQNIVVVHGTCKQLVVAGADHTSQCTGVLMQSQWDTGRIGFYVVPNKDDGLTVTFSGFDGDKVNDNTQIQDLDKILINSQATNYKPIIRPIKGTCTYKVPYAGPQTVICKAKDNQSKKYLLEFNTNSEAPEIIHLPASGGNAAEEG